MGRKREFGLLPKLGIDETKSPQRNRAEEEVVVKMGGREEKSLRSARFCLKSAGNEVFDIDSTVIIGCYVVRV